MNKLAHMNISATHKYIEQYRVKLSSKKSELVDKVLGEDDEDFGFSNLGRAFAHPVTFLPNRICSAPPLEHTQCKPSAVAFLTSEHSQVFASKAAVGR